MDIHHLPFKIIDIKIYENKFTGWEQDAIKGFIYLRDGKDYINNNKRYDTAFEYLTKAYNKLLEIKSDNKMSLARLCLWIGISLNENEDIDKIKRNQDAIKYYKKGLDLIHYVHTKEVLPLRMSLHNSYGVALHHLSIGKKIFKIPQQSIYHYRIARDIFRQSPNNRYMKRIMKKVKSNSGQIVMQGGCSMYIYNDTC